LGRPAVQGPPSPGHPCAEPRPVSQPIFGTTTAARDLAGLRRIAAKPKVGVAVQAFLNDKKGKA